MKYHISVNGQTMGPFEPEQLVNQCGLTMNSYVWNETMTGWQLASTVRELVDLLNAKNQGQPVKYCISINGQTVGPSEPEQLISQYGLTMNSYVWNESMPNWQLAGTVPELATLLAQKAHANNLGVNQEQMSTPDVSVQSIANPKEADLDVIIVEENTNQPKESKPKKEREVNKPNRIISTEEVPEKDRKIKTFYGKAINNGKGVLAKPIDNLITTGGFVLGIAVLIISMLIGNTLYGSNEFGDSGYVLFVFVAAIAIPIITCRNIIQKMTTLRDYVPEKSFSFYRLSESQLRNCFIVIIVLLIIVLIAAYYMISIIKFGKINNGKRIMYILKISIFIGGVAESCYLTYKAYKLIKLHGNVDYVANENLADALGADVDEIVQISTQNFDDTETKTDSSVRRKLLVVTNRKIYYAFYSKKRWKKCVQFIKDIKYLGITYTNFNGSIEIYMSFYDDSTIKFELDVENKFSTTPPLFVRKLLEVIDDYQLGRVVETRTRRRRVTTQDNNKTATGNNMVYIGLSHAEQVTGRKIDL